MRRRHYLLQTANSPASQNIINWDTTPQKTQPTHRLMSGKSNTTLLSLPHLWPRLKLYHKLWRMTVAQEKCKSCHFDDAWKQNKQICQCIVGRVQNDCVTTCFKQEIWKRNCNLPFRNLERRTNRKPQTARSSSSRIYLSRRAKMSWCSSSRETRQEWKAYVILKRNI